MRVPQHLRPATRRWFKTVSERYEMDEHHFRLLQLAGEAWDRGCQAREALAEHGLVYEDRYGGPKARPEIAIERDSRIGFARMLKELGIDSVEPPASPGWAPARANAKRSK
jgi:phage terminase small subunit